MGDSGRPSTCLHETASPPVHVSDIPRCRVSYSLVSVVSMVPEHFEVHRFPFSDIREDESTRIGHQCLLSLPPSSE